MDKLRKVLYQKRKKTEDKIHELSKWDKAGDRYTMMLSDLSFFVCSLFVCLGVALYFVAEIIYLYNYGKAFQEIGIILEVIQYIISILILIALLSIIYLERIKERIIATRKGKNVSYGLLSLSSLLAYIVSVIEIIAISRMGEIVPKSLTAVGVGGAIVFAFTLPIYVSFKKGIAYRCKE